MTTLISLSRLPGCRKFPQLSNQLVGWVLLCAAKLHLVVDAGELVAVLVEADLVDVQLLRIVQWVLL